MFLILFSGFFHIWDAFTQVWRRLQWRFWHVSVSKDAQEISKLLSTIVHRCTVHKGALCIIFKSLHCKLFTVSWWHTSFFIDRFHAYFANHTIGDCCPYHKYFGTVEQIRIGWVLSLSTFAYGVCKKYKCLQLIAIWNNLKNRLVKVERFVSYRLRRIDDSQMNKCYDCHW